MLGGAMWDFGGTWLSYLIGVVWGGVLIVALLCAPEAEFFASPHQEGATRARFRARDIWPRLSDYWGSLMLLERIPLKSNHSLSLGRNWRNRQR
jgi:hypothetical protein